MRGLRHGVPDRVLSQPELAADERGIIAPSHDVQNVLRDIARIPNGVDYF